MHPPPPSSIHLHPAHFNIYPAPSTSTQLISTSTQLHPPPPSSFQLSPSSLQHPQQDSHQNIARNWAISPNLGRKIQRCPFWLKTGLYGILEVVIPKPDFLGKFWPKKSKLPVLSENCHTWYLNDADSYSKFIFWISNPKIHFWANLGSKSQSCPFCLKIGTKGISRMLILIPTLVLWISNSKFPFGQIWVKKVKVVRFVWRLAHMVSRGCWFLFQHLFSEFQTKSQFLGKRLGFAWKLALMVSWRCRFLFWN